MMEFLSINVLSNLFLTDHPYVLTTNHPAMENFRNLCRILIYQFARTIPAC
jgi:hypothetical protein